MSKFYTRRGLLQATAPVFVGGVAGCVSRSSRSPSTTATRTSTTDTATPTTQPESTSLHETLEEKALTADGEWPTSHHDNWNSSYASDASGIPESGTPYWKLKSEVSPVVSDGVLYTRLGERGVVACNAKTGAIEWSTGVRGGSTSLALADSDIVLTTITDTYSIDATTGSVSWSQSLQKGKSSAPKVRDRTVYFCKDAFGDSPARVYALEANTGACRWTEKLEGQIGGTVAVEQESVYATAAGLYAFDRATGTELWSFSTRAPVETYPVVANNRVYTADEAGFVYAVSAETGDLDWRTDVGSPPESGGLAVTPQAVYYSGRDGLYALDEETGERRWQFETQAGAAEPTVADGTVYFGTALDGRYLYAIDTENGEEVWHYQFPQVMRGDAYYGGIYTSPVVVDNAVYIRANDGYLYALGKE